MFDAIRESKFDFTTIFVGFINYKVDYFRRLAGTKQQTPKSTENSKTKSLFPSGV